MPMSRRSGGRAVTSRSWRRICPFVGRKYPPINLRRVALPPPEGPSRLKKVPAVSLRLMSEITGELPKAKLMPSSRRAEKGMSASAIPHHLAGPDLLDTVIAPPFFHPSQSGDRFVGDTLLPHGRQFVREQFPAIHKKQ